MFEIRVNGEPMFKTESQVIGVSLQSGRGELFRAGISNEGVIDVKLDTVNAGDPQRLDQLEAAQARFQRSLVEGHPTGTPPLASDRTMNTRQELQDDTLRPGGPSSEIAQQGFMAPPAVDLASGLDPRHPNYGDIITARIEAFNDHGDAQRAVDDIGADYTPQGDVSNQQPGSETLGDSPTGEAQPSGPGVGTGGTGATGSDTAGAENSTTTEQTTVDPSANVVTDDEQADTGAPVSPGVPGDSVSGEHPGEELVPAPQPSDEQVDGGTNQGFSLT